MTAANVNRYFSYRQPAELTEEHPGLSYLLAAAVVNRQFRQLLLDDPEIALQRGYLGERFDLSREERERVTSVRAESLAELAGMIANS